MSLPVILSGKRQRYFCYLIFNGSAQAALAVSMALLVKHAFDRLVAPVGAGGVSEAAMLSAALTTIIAASAWLQYRSKVDAERLGQGYVHDVRLYLFRHLTAIGGAGAGRMSHGALMLRFVGDLNALRLWVSLGLARLVVSGLAAGLSIAALIVIEPFLALAVALASTAAAGLALLVGPRLRSRTRETRKRRGRLAAVLSDRVSGLSVVEAFGREAAETRRIARLSSRVKSAAIQRARSVGLLRALSEASASTASACALLIGSLQVAIGQTTPGAVVAAMVVAGLLAPRIQDLGRVYEYWNGFVVAREKQQQVLALRPVRRAMPDRTKPPLSAGPGRLTLTDIHLDPVLNGISLAVEPGDRVAVVGANGAGKSTLLRTMAGLATPDSGSVALDGQDIIAHEPGSVRAAFALVSPDLPLLRGSVRFNLTYGAADTADTEINAVIDKLGLSPVIGRLRKGLDTRISAGGSIFSTGERARIALGRALLSNARVLLLDEADANLDASASALMEQASALFDGAIIMVTHDPLVASGADRRYLLRGGQLVPLADDAPEQAAEAGPTVLRFCGMSA